MGISANTRPKQPLLFLSYPRVLRVPILVSEHRRVEGRALRGIYFSASVADWSLSRLALSAICGSPFSILRGCIRTDRGWESSDDPAQPDWLGNGTRKTLSGGCHYWQAVGGRRARCEKSTFAGREAAMRYLSAGLTIIEPYRG